MANAKCFQARQCLRIFTMKNFINSEQYMPLWSLTQKWSQGIPISGPILMVKALELNEKIDPDKQQFNLVENFSIKTWYSLLFKVGNERKQRISGSLKETLSELIEEEGLVFVKHTTVMKVSISKDLLSKTLASHNESKAPGSRSVKKKLPYWCVQMPLMNISCLWLWLVKQRISVVLVTCS